MSKPNLVRSALDDSPPCRLLQGPAEPCPSAWRRPWVDLADLAERIVEADPELARLTGLRDRTDTGGTVIISAIGGTTGGG